MAERRGQRTNRRARVRPERAPPVASFVVTFATTRLRRVTRDGRRPPCFSPSTDKPYRPVAIFVVGLWPVPFSIGTKTGGARKSPTATCGTARTNAIIMRRNFDASEMIITTDCFPYTEREPSNYYYFFFRRKRIRRRDGLVPSCPSRVLRSKTKTPAVARTNLAAVTNTYGPGPRHYLGERKNRRARPGTMDSSDGTNKGRRTTTGRPVPGWGTGGNPGRRRFRVRDKTLSRRPETPVLRIRTKLLSSERTVNAIGNGNRSETFPTRPWFTGRPGTNPYE